MATGHGRAAPDGLADGVRVLLARLSRLGVVRGLERVHVPLGVETGLFGALGDVLRVEDVCLRLMKPGDGVREGRP